MRYAHADPWLRRHANPDLDTDVHRQCMQLHSSDASEHRPRVSLHSARGWSMYHIPTTTQVGLLWGVAYPPNLCTVLDLINPRAHMYICVESDQPLQEIYACSHGTKLLWLLPTRIEEVLHRTADFHCTCQSGGLMWNGGRRGEQLGCRSNAVAQATIEVSQYLTA